jgi:magnesium-transporting ATPase (P-type)
MASIAMSVGITFLILAIVVGYSAIDAIVFMIGIIIANVPEGLLPQLTVALTITAQRMRDKEVVVTNLDIIESLGAVTVICSDKTGTLTCNRMTVAHVAYDKTVYKTPITVGLESDIFVDYEVSSPSFQAIFENAILNTEAHFLSNEEDILKREIKGDASEGALIKFAEGVVKNQNSENNIENLRSMHKKHFMIPFNSTNKWMLTITSPLENGVPKNNLTLHMKGAPEKIIAKCSHYLIEGVSYEINSQIRQDLEDLNTTLASRGERVLGFAKYDLPEQFNSNYEFFDDEPFNFPVENLTFIGFFALIDPPRPAVKKAVSECNTAGVKVIMVTGDHPTTAHAIAKSLNLITKKTHKEYVDEGLEVPPEGAKSIVVKGTDLLTYSDEDWKNTLCHEEIVFARTMPQQKQDIVNELIKMDHIIAMTGDGVNDAPALKAAHVGIAMGSGAAVAKEAGQIILLNDDFSSIVEGIREGRLIFENLKKCICYVITSNIPELIPFLLFIAMKIPLSIETIMIILIDVGTDIAPAICLAYEEPEEMIMNIPPRSRDAHLASVILMGWSYGIYGIIQTFFAYWAWMWVYVDYGFSVTDLIGSGVAYRDSWDAETMKSVERRTFFTNMCLNNKFYQENLFKYGNNCEQDFKDYLIQILSVAQTTFLMTIVWVQIACLFIRKTQMATIFNWYRLKSNKAILVGVGTEVVLLMIFVYIPGFNHALFMTGIHPKYASTGLWGLAFFICFDELRKYLCRIPVDTESGEVNCLQKHSCF